MVPSLDERGRPPVMAGEVFAAGYGGIGDDVAASSGKSLPAATPGSQSTRSLSMTRRDGQVNQRRPGTPCALYAPAFDVINSVEASTHRHCPRK